MRLVVVAYIHEKHVAPSAIRLACTAEAAIVSIAVGLRRIMARRHVPWPSRGPWGRWGPDREVHATDEALGRARAGRVDPARLVSVIHLCQIRHVELLSFPRDVVRVVA